VLRRLDAVEADAVAGLIGIPRPAAGHSVRIPLATIDRALRSSAAGCGLVELLEHLGGPLRNRREERATADAARAQEWAALGSHPVVERDERLAGWLEELRRTGLARRLAGAQEADAVKVALDVLALLDRRREQDLRLGVLAAEVTCDAHGLDRRRPAGTLAVHALSWLDGRPFPEDAADWRRAWAEAGVACDDLSCDVLVLCVPSWPPEPLRLTLRQVTRWQPPGGPVDVFACENPAVVAAAADAFDHRSPPIVCVEGMPSTAAMMLLEGLTADGGTIRYHGDFDWRGLAIASVVFRKLPRAQPWRYGAIHYERAVEAGLGTMPLRGRPQSSPWDSALTAAMATAGVAVYEEQVLPDLLDDLATHTPFPATTRILSR
jgi:uncharacterized protein (TIGR02679 family)